MKISLQTAGRQRTRAHRVLFDRDLPFKPKSERRRDTYQRRVKNRRQDHTNWDND